MQMEWTDKEAGERLSTGWGSWQEFIKNAHSHDKKGEKKQKELEKLRENF